MMTTAGALDATREDVSTDAVWLLSPVAHYEAHSIRLDYWGCRKDELASEEVILKKRRS